MAGTKLGGLRARATTIARHGNDFYSKIGQKGGKAGHTGGFAANPELAKKCGSIGGKLSKRGIAMYGRTSDGKPITKAQASSKYKVYKEL